MPDGGSSSQNSQNTKTGLTLFGVYLLLYGGFVLINAFAPTAMESTPIAGVNLAILYGFALIIAAFVMALLYGWLCRGTGQGEVEQGDAGRGDGGEGGA